jgi:hypothetical protein
MRPLISVGEDLSSGMRLVKIESKFMRVSNASPYPGCANIGKTLWAAAQKERLTHVARIRTSAGSIAWPPKAQCTRTNSSGFLTLFR